LDFQPVEPVGTVYTFTTQHHSTGSKFDGDLPFATVVVALRDIPNVRVVGLFDGEALHVKVGMPVTGRYLDATSEVSLLQFTRSDQ
jgi:uncharacterized OB-fold protein